MPNYTYKEENGKVHLTFVLDSIDEAKQIVDFVNDDVKKQSVMIDRKGLNQKFYRYGVIDIFGVIKEMRLYLPFNLRTCKNFLDGSVENLTYTQIEKLALAGIPTIPV